jgi:hypothetical protein
MYKLFLILIFLVSTAYLQAQTTYGSITASYGLEASGHQVEGYHNAENDNLSAQISQPMFSLGQGLYFGGSLGFFSSRNIGFDFSIQYHAMTRHSFYQNTIINTVLSEVEKTIYGNRFLLLPSFTMQMEPALITPYFKIGPSIAVINQRVEETTIILNKESKQMWKYTGPISLGLHAGVGLSITIHEDIQLCLGMDYMAMNYRPTSFDLKTSSQNGMNNRPDLQYFEQHVVFTDWAEEAYNQQPQDPNDPVIMNTPNFAYHSINLQLGFRFLF